MLKKIFIVLFVCLSLVIAKESESQVFKQKLVLGVVKTSKDIKLQQKINSIVKYLQKELNADIRIYYTVDAKSIIKGLRYNLVDLAYLDAFSLVNAVDVYKFEVIVAEKNRNRYGYLVVPKSSNINFLSDIGSFDKIAIVNNRLASFLYLKKQTELSDVNFNFVSTYSHEKSLKSIVKSNYDFKEKTRGIKPKKSKESKSKFVAALVDSEEYDKFLEEYTKNDYRIIWKTPKIPGCGVVVNNNLPFKLKKELTNSLLLYHSKSLISYVKFIKFDKRAYHNIKSLSK